MNVKVTEIETKSYISPSELPAADYVINPYVGCVHKCMYCYAEFMKRFTKHTEDWGDFLDVKRYDRFSDILKVDSSKTILIGSVTDAYNPLEAKYGVTRSILEHMASSTANIQILTKSHLVTRDIDLFSNIRNIEVGISMNTLDDQFRKKTEPFASPVSGRIAALKELKQNGIGTYLFMSPIFPGITDYKALVRETMPYVDYVCFENLNLRGAYRKRVLEFIHTDYPELYPLYQQIYCKKDMAYWSGVETDIISYCRENGVRCKMYFFHDKIKKRN